MPWRLNVHPEHPVAVTEYLGAMTPEELGAAFEATLRYARDVVARGQTALLLGDCTGLTGGHSVFDLVSLADALERTGVAHHLKEAVLMPNTPGSAQDVEFWETACLNRGIRVRLFQDRKAALAWLLS